MQPGIDEVGVAPMRFSDRQARKPDDSPRSVLEWTPFPRICPRFQACRKPLRQRYLHRG
jgi:hypothetical protein